MLLPLPCSTIIFNLLQLVLEDMLEDIVESSF